MNNAGKGDKQRPTDNKKYSENYDMIFGNKTQRLPQVATMPVIEQKPYKIGENK